MGGMKHVREPAGGTEGGTLSWDESFNGEFACSTLLVNTVDSSGGGGGVGGGNNDLERLIRLFTNEDTAEIAERQLVVLRQVCKGRQRG